MKKPRPKKAVEKIGRRVPTQKRSKAAGLSEDAAVKSANPGEYFGLGFDGHESLSIAMSAGIVSKDSTDWSERTRKCAQIIGHFVISYHREKSTVPAHEFAEWLSRIGAAAEALDVMLRIGPDGKFAPAKIARSLKGIVDSNESIRIIGDLWFRAGLESQEQWEANNMRLIHAMGGPDEAEIRTQARRRSGHALITVSRPLLKLLIELTVAGQPAPRPKRASNAEAQLFEGLCSEYRITTGAEIRTRGTTGRYDPDPRAISWLQAMLRAAPDGVFHVNDCPGDFVMDRLRELANLAPASLAKRVIEAQKAVRSGVPVISDPQ
jgi:hypothetical protein